jgi:hypothetical protein
MFPSRISGSASVVVNERARSRQAYARSRIMARSANIPIS